MIAVDTDVLVHAHREESHKPVAAHARVVSLAESSSRWAIPVFCIGEFVRVIIHPRLFDPPYSAHEACEALTRVLASLSVTVLCPGSEYPALLAEATREANDIGNLVFDALVVALCRERGIVRLMTEDRDFDRFKDLRTGRPANGSNARECCTPRPEGGGERSGRRKPTGGAEASATQSVTPGAKNA